MLDWLALNAVHGASQFTNEVAVFDLLDIGLVHGWLCDPQVRSRAASVGCSNHHSRAGGGCLPLQHNNAQAAAAAAAAAAQRMPAELPTCVCPVPLAGRGHLLRHWAEELQRAGDAAGDHAGGRCHAQVRHTLRLLPGPARSGRAGSTGGCYP